MPCKVVLFYNQGSAGWSETFYHPETSPQAIASRDFAAVWKAAIKFRAPPTQLFAVRASNVDTPRLSAIFYTASTYQIDPPGVNTPATVSNDAYFALQDSSTHKRPLLLRGLYDEAISRDQAGVDSLGPWTNDQVKAYIKALGTAGFTIRWLDLPPLPGAGWAAVQSVGPHAGSARLADLILPAMPTVPIVQGQKLYFRGIPTDALPGFPRQAIVLGVTIGGGGVTVVIEFDVRAFQQPFMPEKMFATQVKYSYTPIGFGTFIRFSKRSTGRPIGVLRGAARARVRRL